ncbi:MAG: hypothetical protein NTV08_04300 [Verrucomicrobia bacterium]|nr:hypothetical protein [Verrucomicrobiota bacterium]
MDTFITPTAAFWYEGAFYNIKDAGIVDGKPYAVVQPENPGLVEKLCRDIKKNGTYSAYMSGSCYHFPEDLKKFEEWKQRQK